jgi:putative glutamine amidotransferase
MALRPDAARTCAGPLLIQFIDPTPLQAMPAKPVILISGSTDDRGAEFTDYSLSLSMNYPAALVAAGGLPWLLPCQPERGFVAEAVRRANGILLTGGDDIDPKLYTRSLPARVAKTVHCAHPDRDRFELMLIDEVFRQRKPLLCICRGHQILNVALGGTLFADIPQQIPRAMNHSRIDRKDRVVHDVVCEPGSLMAAVAGGNRLGVNSSHHQAVAQVAKPLRVTAVSRDGVVEGLELAPEAAVRHYLLAVQFHPERLFARHAEHLELFRTFVRACRRKR